MEKKIIILATNNPHKKIEVNKIVNSNYIKFIDCSDVNIKLDVEETGKTYQENAYLKSKFVFDRIGLPVCSDDSGIEIEFFDYKPGVNSARYLSELNYYQKNSKILELLSNTDKRYARYVCAISYIDKNQSFFIEDICEGTISKKIYGNRGFGYDPIFIPDGYDETFGQISSEIKNEISHRAKSFKKLCNKLLTNNQ